MNNFTQNELVLMLNGIEQQITTTEQHIEHGKQFGLNETNSFHFMILAQLKDTKDKIVTLLLPF